MGLWDRYSNIAKNDTLLKLYNAANILLLIFVIIALFSGHETLARFAWLLAFVMAISYTYVHRDLVRAMIEARFKNAETIVSKQLDHHRKSVMLLQGIKDTSKSLDPEVLQVKKQVDDSIAKAEQIAKAYNNAKEIPDADLVKYDLAVKHVEKTIRAYKEAKDDRSRKAAQETMNDAATGLMTDYGKYDSKLQSLIGTW